MEYDKDDRWLFGLKDEADKATWIPVALLVLLIIGNLALSGCDAESAEVTAKIEQDTYEKWMDGQAHARYRPSDNPIKASTLEANFTICQQYEEVNRKWVCWSVK